MTVIIHNFKRCGGSIVVDISKGLDILCDFSVQKTGLRVERLHIENSLKKMKPDFSCLNCGEKEISLEEITILCDYCGNRSKTSKSISFFPSLAAFYCTICEKKHLNEKETKIKKNPSNILSNISLIPSKKPHGR